MSPQAPMVASPLLLVGLVVRKLRIGNRIEMNVN